MNLKLIPFSPLARLFGLGRRSLPLSFAGWPFLLLFILGLCVASPASAQLTTGTTATGLVYQVNSGQVSIIKYVGSGGDVFIPGQISNSGTDLPVTSIGVEAFAWCSSLISVSIPSSVTWIEGVTFEGSSNLISITVDEANPEYSSLDGVLFDKSKAELITCPPGKSGIYSIPESVTWIDHSAFFRCSGLTNVNIPNSVTRIGQWAFASCSGLTSVNIPSSVTFIDDFAFGWCSSLVSISVDESNPAYTGLDGVLFDKLKATLIVCPAGKSGNYTIPGSVISIDDDAFLSCSSLISVTIPNSVTSIGDVAFDGCASLTSVTIPNSVTSIGYSAFADCSSLTSVTILGSIGSISSNAFGECASLNSALFMGDAPSMGPSVFSGAASDFTVYYFNGAYGFASPRWTTSSNESYRASNLGNREEGVLQVVIDPPGAANAGARWRVDGGAWKKSGSLVGSLSVGRHLLDFKGARGWRTPAAQFITVIAGSGGVPLATTGTYASFANSFTGMLEDGGGLLKLSLARSGRFTGSLVLRGKTYRVSGAFDANGEYEGRIGTPPLDLALRIDLSQTDSSDMTLTGSVGGVALTAYSTSFNKKKPADCAGKYTLLLQPTGSSSADAPQGSGFARMTVRRAGSVAVVGKLADNTSFSASGPIVGGSSGNQFFLYHRGIYGGKGLLAGTITFEPLETSDCDGALQWYKPPQKSGNYFKEGFDTDLAVAGARYSNPHEQGMQVPTLTLALGGGGLDSPISATVALSPSNSFTVSGDNPEKLKLTLNPASGLLRGSFIHPAIHRPVIFNGILYHYPFAPTPGAGFFLGPVISGTGSSGAVSLIH